MKLQFWSKEMCAMLLETYQYDKVTGEVTRKHWNNKGPKKFTALGSANAHGDVLLAVWFAGKQWTIRVTKLCYFLATGDQHQRFDWKDGNKKNNSFDNIMPLGPVMVGEKEFIAALNKDRQEKLVAWEQQALLAQLEMDKKAEERKKEYEEGLKKAREARILKNPLRAEKYAEQMKQFEKRERRRKQDEEMKEKYPNGYERPRNMWEEIHSDDINGQLKITRAIKEEWFEESWLEQGLWTGCKKADIDNFVKKYDDMFGTLSTEEGMFQYFEKDSSLEDQQRALGQLDKWRHDRWRVYQLNWQLEKDWITPAGVHLFFLHYEWKGQPFHRSEVLPSHLLLKKEELLTALRISIADRERELERREGEHEADKELLKSLNPAIIVSPAYESAMQAEKESEE